MSPPSSNAAGEELVLRGVIDRIRFQNPSTGYTVFLLKIAGNPKPYTVVATHPALTAGQQVMVRGYETSHVKYGDQVEAISVMESAPSTSEGIERFLSSGLVKGIGEKTAERLVEEFGADTLRMLVEEPEQVAKLSGVGKSKAKKLQEALGSKQAVQEVMQFLVENNISTTLAHKIYEKYSNRAVEILKQDPYLLTRELRGIGFIKADTIALNLGLPTDAPQRLKAALYYALEKASEDGHCFLYDEQIVSQARRLLGTETVEGEELERQLMALVEESYVVKEEDRYYLSALFRAEEFVAKFLSRRAQAESVLSVSDQLVQQALNEAGSELSVEFSAEQQSAILAAARKQLVVITGGPGCGKTTIIRALTKLFDLAHKELRLTAPTGRAAQRMAQVCDKDASTIHRLLRYDPFRRSFFHGINDPLPCDVVVVDESSMIDIQLARDLFSAIPKHATLILVGDKDQLPSVGPGKVFQDIVSRNEITVIGLSRLYRRKQQSQITDAAHMINAGTVPPIPEPDGNTKSDAYFIPKKDASESAVIIENLFAKQLPSKFGFAPEEIVVLTPTNRGDLGTETLNKRLQDRVNPYQGGPQLLMGSHSLRVGDRVCQRVNNYQIDEYGVFNGDLGLVTEIDAVNKTAHVELWDGRLIKYSSKELGQLSLAYAMTVHRSQGSEIPCVILALHDSHYGLLERQLIYTGVTRAKRLLVIVGSKRALAIATKRAHSQDRQTHLSAKIRV